MAAAQLCHYNGNFVYRPAESSRTIVNSVQNARFYFFFANTLLQLVVTVVLGLRIFLYFRELDKHIRTVCPAIQFAGLVFSRSNTSLSLQRKILVNLGLPCRAIESAGSARSVEIFPDLKSFCCRRESRRLDCSRAR
jgi:hypothetical protein